MNKDRILSHIGLSLVTYVPLVMTTIIVLTAEPLTVEELFSFGALLYMVIATIMLMLAGGWYVYLFIAVSLIISITGLTKKENFPISITTFLICIAWVVGYLVVHSM